MRGAGSAFLRFITPKSRYRDRQFVGSDQEYGAALERSSTVYVGNLAFFTTEEQIYEVFSRAGEIKRIVMGLDRNTHSPCGFCFVEYYTSEDAKTAEWLVTMGGVLVDERSVKVDADHGFVEGRQFGRGLQGGQVRDERTRNHYKDPGRPQLYRQHETSQRRRSRSRSRSKSRSRSSDDERRGPRKRLRDHDLDLPEDNAEPKEGKEQKL